MIDDFDMNRPQSRWRSWMEKLLVRGTLLAAVAFLLSALGGWSQVRARAMADSTAAAVEITAARQHGQFDTKYDRAQNELRLVGMQLERARIIKGYARRYRIDTALAGAIYDIARDEGIAPATAFRLVQVESSFRRTARSTADAFGYTQVQVPTARFYDRNVTQEKLMERDVNLRIGFRYLRDLLEQFDGDMHIALLAYNRGPGRVTRILAEGGNPGNGYSSAILGSKPPAPLVRGMSD